MDDAYADKLGFMKNGKRTDYPDFKYMAVCNDELPPPKTFREKDIEEYAVLVKAFRDLGFTEEEQDAIHRITAASLWVGEIELNEKTYNDTTRPPKPVTVTNMDVVAKLAGLLGIKDPEEIVINICHKEANKMDAGAPRVPAKP